MPAAASTVLQWNVYAHVITSGAMDKQMSEHSFIRLASLAIAAIVGRISGRATIGFVSHTGAELGSTKASVCNGFLDVSSRTTPFGSLSNFRSRPGEKKRRLVSVTLALDNGCGLGHT